MRVFISAATTTYGQFRTDLALNARHGGLNLIIQGSSLGDHGLKPLTELDLEISAADVVVHFIGGDPGSPLGQDQYIDDLLQSTDTRARFQRLLPFLWSGDELVKRVTYTQWEAYLALLHGRKLWVCQREQESLEDNVSTKVISWREHLINLRSCGLASTIRQFVNDGWFACELFGQLVDERLLMDRRSELRAFNFEDQSLPKQRDSNATACKDNDLERVYSRHTDWTEVRFEPKRPGEVGQRIWFKL